MHYEKTVGGILEWIVVNGSDQFRSVSFTLRGVWPKYVESEAYELGKAWDYAHEVEEKLESTSMRHVIDELETTSNQAEIKLLTMVRDHLDEHIRELRGDE